VDFDVIEVVGKRPCGPMPKARLTAWGAYAINAAVRESMPQFREPVLAHLFIGQTVDEATLLLILPQEGWGAIPPFSDDVDKKICNGPNPVLNAVLARLSSENVVAEAPVDVAVLKNLGIQLRVMRGVVVAGQPDLPRAAAEALRYVFGDFSRPGEVLAEYVASPLKNRATEREVVKALALGLLQPMSYGILQPSPKLYALVELANRIYT